jgi:hypothetical protein
MRNDGCRRQDLTFSFPSLASPRLHLASPREFACETNQRLQRGGPCVWLLIASIPIAFIESITMASSFKIKLKLPPNPNQPVSTNNSPQRSSVPAEGPSSVADGGSSVVSEDMGEGERRNGEQAVA